MAQRKAEFELSPDYAHHMKTHFAVRDRAQSLPLRDGVLLNYLHNKFRLGPKPQGPNIGWKEAFPRTPALFINLALRRVHRLIDGCIAMPRAVQSDTLAMAEFRQIYPGFSDESYRTAFNYANFVMR